MMRHASCAPDCRTHRGEPYLRGPTFAATFHTAGAPADAPFTYGRFHNPTWRVRNRPRVAGRRADGTVSVGHGCVGRGARHRPAPGSTSRDAGGLLLHDATHRDGIFRGNGRRGGDGANGGRRAHRAVAGATPAVAGVADESRRSTCATSRDSANAAHAAGALVAVDNTTATALCQQPLALGADFIGVGHQGDDGTRRRHARACRLPRRRIGRPHSHVAHAHGQIPGPMEVWLAHRSLGTLDVRLERQCESALRVAEFLRASRRWSACDTPVCPTIRHMRWPRQMSLVRPGDQLHAARPGAVERFFAASTLVHEATSFGGIHTSAERRARWGADAVSEGFVRFSVGVEDVNDLLDDLTRL